MKKDILFRLLFVVVIISLDKEFAFAEDSKIVLGRKLYFDTQLSVDNDISCNSCHDLKNFGVDSNPTSPGHKGQQGERNSPTVYNAALHFTQFWDGRAKDVEEQALGPVLNPIEMAMPSEEEVVKRLKANPEYLDLFKQSFPEKDPITFINMGKAIGAFERTLVTKSRFDKWKAGDSNALSPEEVKGYNKFQEIGCTACHSGDTFGGSMFQKLGLVKNYTTLDTGRHKHTGLDTDKFFFKVPSLLNIAKTSPYFHDGSVRTLPEAVKIMGEYQLGKNLDPKEVELIVSFLHTLTGELPEEYQ